MQDILKVLFPSLCILLVIANSGCINTDVQNETQECTTSYMSKCYENNVYWYDSCDNREGIKERCDLGCEDNTCIGEVCTSQYAKICHNNNVYWIDSCGNTEELSEECDNGCNESQCITTCISHFDYKCQGGVHVHWYDSCGNVETIKEVCEFGCVNKSCSLTEDDRCIGVDCDDDNKCTEDECRYGGCFHTEYENGTECGDDMKCINGNCIECVPDTSSECLNEGISTNGKLYWYDSCGLSNRVEDCDFACFSGDCINFDEMECIDSDDMYEDQEFYPGTTTIRLIENTSYIVMSRNDICYVHDTFDNLIEYSCGTNEIVSESLICQYGCTEEDPAYCNTE